MTGLSPDRLDAAGNALPPSSLVLKNDAADPASADELAGKVAEMGGLDGLWLNAGYADVAAIEDTEVAFFDRMMAANVRGPVLQIVSLSKFLNKGASVVLTSSTSTYEGAAMASVYAATKGALVSLARCWASALGDRGIRVNTLVPGPIDTDFRDFMPKDVRQAFEKDMLGRVPLGRIGSAEEAAAVALFLLSDDTSFVTGAQFAVDGGLTMQ